MTLDQAATHSRINAVRPPSYLIEYGYYAVLFYAMLGEALGILFPLIGSGALAGLAMLCVMHFGARAKGLYGPIALGLACAISTVLLQLLVHQETLMNSGVRIYFTWALSLVIIQALFLRQGFFHRFAIFAFLLGCATLPWLETYVSSGELTRLGVSHDVGLANPNAFGMWFGFCSVYFIVRGLEAQNNIVRLASWLAGLLSLYLVGITVSRTPLLGVAIATVVAFQKVLKRSFLPILALFFLFWIIYVIGLFDEVIGYYTKRGTKESGRTDLWSIGFDMFRGSWWSGLGISHSQISAPGRGDEGTPHNGLLFIGLQSGIIPLMFFVGYITRAGFRAWLAREQRTSDAPFRLPLYLFAFLEMMTLDTVFMDPWAMVVLTAAMAAGQGPRVGQKARVVATGSRTVEKTAVF